MKRNLDPATIDSFGDEWMRFDQSRMGDDEAKVIFDEYFSVFPWEILPANPIGFDMGCGSGRWARLVAPRVAHLHCIDPSSALDVARKALASYENVSFHRASVDDSPLPCDSQDFGYSLGVLHHIPDATAAMRSCVAMLKRGAPFQVYLYYAFDNRPMAFRLVWRMSDTLRRAIRRLPSSAKHVVTDLLAAFVYWPFARAAGLLEKMGMGVANIPLSYYRNRSWYTMRTDSRDRFGTPLEQRFTKVQIRRMMEEAGLRDIQFSENAPYWCAVGVKA